MISKHVFSLCTFLFLAEGLRLLGVGKDGNPWEARLLRLHVPRYSQQRGWAAFPTDTNTNMHMQYIHTWWCTQMYVDRNTQHSHGHKQHLWSHSVPLPRQTGWRSVSGKNTHINHVDPFSNGHRITWTFQLAHTHMYCGSPVTGLRHHQYLAPGSSQLQLPQTGILANLWTYIWFETWLPGHLSYLLAIPAWHSLAITHGYMYWHMHAPWSLQLLASQAQGPLCHEVLPSVAGT